MGKQSNDEFEEMMNLMKITESMLRLIYDGIYLTYRCVTKDNDIKLNAFTVTDKDKSFLSPTIYIDGALDRIKNGISDPKTEASKIVAIYNDNIEAIPRYNSISDFFRPENFFVTVVNSDLNKERLENIIHTRINDLSLVLRCRVGENASFAVPVSSLSELSDKKLTQSEAMDIGISNSLAYGYDIIPMQNMLKSLKPDLEFDQDIIDETIHNTPQYMYVIKSKDEITGAASVFIDQEIRAQLSKYMPGDGYILLPSSKFEMIAVPADDTTDSKDLLHIVTDINASVLDPQDKLSDSIYYVDKATLRITTINEATFADTQTLYQTQEAKAALVM